MYVRVALSMPDMAALVHHSSIDIMFWFVHSNSIVLGTSQAPSSLFTFSLDADVTALILTPTDQVDDELVSGDKCIAKCQ